MSAISTILARLRAAIWAIDVRDDIANAIEQCYSDVSNPTLKTEALEAALQTKIDAGEMAALTIGDHTITAAKLAQGVIDNTLATSGAAADAKKTGDEIAAVKADLGSFKETGGADKYISNVRVYGSPASIGISNISNNYGSSGSEQTGFAIFTTTSDTAWVSAIKNVTNAAISGHFKETLSDGRTYEFDYDLSGLASGTRDTARDAAHIIKSTCFYNAATLEELGEVSESLNEATDALQGIQSDFVEPGGASKYIKNVKVHGPAGYTVIINLRHNFVASSGVQSGFTICIADENGINISQIKNVSDSASGHFFEKLGDGRSYEFDYDLSEIPEGTRITDTGLAYLIKESCFDSVSNDNLYVGLGAFDTFGVVGDSYASGSVYYPDGNGYTARTYYKISWGQIIARKYGNTCINFSKGGLTTRSWLTDPMGLTLLQSSEPLPLYLLALGANDIGKLGASYIGSASDIHVDNPSLNADTFYGNYGKIISSIIAKSPTAKIILFTVAYKYNDLEKQFNTAIRNIANTFGVPCVTLSSDRYYAEDSVYNTKRVQNHPTAVLYAGMAEANIRLIDRCVYGNLDYFADYEPITQ